MVGTLAAIAMGERRRVVILGAGPSGLTTAWHLSEPALQGAVEVTVYQMGWRAGGLCASGRVGDVQWLNQNGTHYMFGCYHQSRALMEAAFAVLAEHDDNRFGTCAEQLVARDLVVLKQLYKCGWTDWSITLPTLPDDEVRPWSTQHGLARLLGASLGRLLKPDLVEHMRRGVAAVDPGHGLLSALLDKVESLVVDPFERLTRDAIVQVERFVLGRITPAEQGAMVDVAKLVRRVARDVLGPLSELDVDILRALILTDLGLTIFVGALEDRAYTAEGLAKMDALDFRAWLTAHGGAAFAVDSAATQVWYAAIAAFAGGSPNAPSAAAGASLVCMLELLFNYRGSVAYQFKSEIGDSFIGPIVAALQHRGVRFEYFHRVWDVVPGDDGRIARVVLERQATLKDPTAPYDPFVPGLIPGRAVWPDEPNWSQLDEVHGPRNPGMWQDLYTPRGPIGEHCPLPQPFEVASAAPRPVLPAMDNVWYPKAGPEVVLTAGVDFDVLVTALRHTVYPLSAPSLLAASRRWLDAVYGVGGLETQSLRIWFKCSLPAVGWNREAPILSSYILPYATWEDPTPVLESEGWGDRVHAVSHLLGPLVFNTLLPNKADPGDPREEGLQRLAVQHQRALFDAATWARFAVGTLWPGAASPLQPCSLSGELVTAVQVRPNTGPDQLYTAILPGTAQHRLRAAETGYPNLVVAGDWTYTRLLTGSLEGAVDSGRSAANAVLNALSS